MSSRFERTAQLRHQTLGVQHLAVRSEDYWDFQPEQRVETADGFPGTVTAVLDGPFPGSEEYQVTLDGGMGGGSYTASQLRPAAATTAAMEQTAAADYPELAQVLVERPDPALQQVYASRTAPAPKALPPAPSPQASELFASLITTAAADADFRFHVTAAWRDVVAKAKRLRAEGRLRVTLSSDGYVFAEVKGDHHVYETGLQRLPGKTAAHSWSCGCKWGAYHWGADDDFSRFAGRMCSHALALQYEAQSRGMFGRDIVGDDERPSWTPRKVVVRYDIDADTHRLAPSTARKLASWDAPEPSMWDMDGDHDHEAERRAKSDEWDSIHEGLGDIHRGVNVHLRPEDHAIVHDATRPMHERAQHLLKALPHSELARGSEGLGRHWTDNHGVAESFGEMDSSRNRHGWHPTSVVFHAEKPDRHAIDEDPDQSDGDIYGYHDHGESEIPLHPGAGVNLKGVSWKNMNTPDEDFQTVKGDGLFDHLWEHQRHDFGPHGHPAHASLQQAPMSIVARAAVAAGEAQPEVELALRAVGVQVTASDDEECESCSEPFYDGQSHECQHCGGEHHTNCCEYDTGHTDWDNVYPHLNGVHRGFAVNLPSDVHASVHDPQKPIHERAHALLDSVAEGNDGFGMHWSSNPSQAEHYSHVSHSDRGPDGGHQSTHVVLHAKTPSREDIETDHDTLLDHRVIGYDKHDDHEVPIQRGADVHISGVSWKEPHKHEWTRHDFGKPVQHTASADAPFGEPSGTSHQLPKMPGATSPKFPWENPASAGPLAGADPVGWNRQLPLGSYASLDDAALFEPGGAEATLDEEPEGALPATDGVQLPSNDEALTPSMTAGLKRQALKDFTLAERQALIDEGENVRAANLDRLEIDGTHYADLEQVLAAQEDDTTWLER